MTKWNTVAIVGVGLIGGSIGLALRQRELAARVVGIGRKRANLNKAKLLGAIDEGTTDLAKGVSEAEIVVVCTPVESIASTVQVILKHAPAYAVITDAGSTKEQIVAELGKETSAAAKKKKAGPQFIGSHPLAGSEKTGVEFSRADLLQDRVVVITPTKASSPAGVARLVDFWGALGAEIISMSPLKHDQLLAATSHVPHVVSAALAAATPENALDLVAGGWLDTTRIAGGDADLWRQILLSNRDHILKSLDKFGKVLSSLREALASGDGPRLAQLLEAGKQRRDLVGS